MSTEEQEPVVIRDNRKIDRHPTVQSQDAGTIDTDLPTIEEPATESQVPMVEAALLDERTSDLQRVQAEYANYRKRAERDRLAAGDIATGRVLAELLPVIDDLDRAKAHDDLSGPLKAVSDKLEGVFAKLGLSAFGTVGDPFDPSLHDAVLHDESDTVTSPTCTTIMRQGYRHHDRLLRPAMVGVSDPVAEHAAPESQGEAPNGAETHETPPAPHDNEVHDGQPEATTGS